MSDQKKPTPAQPIGRLAIRRRQLLALGGASMLPWMTPGHVRAQASLPPARFIVPFTAGGGTDGTARFMQEALSEHLGTTVIIENRPGGGTTLAANLVAKAPLDGSVFMLTTIAHAVNPSLYDKLPYDTALDLLPISLVTSAPMMMVVNPSVPAHTLQEFIALAKSNPGMLNYASPGNGSPANLAGELLKSMAGIDVVHVPYKGAGPATNDLVGGRVQMTFSSQVIILPFIKAGTVRALAGTTQKRSSALPNVPTMAQAGLPDYSLTSWQAVIAPGKTPPEVAQRLNRAVVACLTDPTVNKNLTQQGLEVTPTSLDHTNTFVNSEITRFGELIRKAKIHADA